MNCLNPAFPTDYASIQKRIETIDPVAYGKTRNYLTGAVTYLSPYISRGFISTKQVLENVLNRGYALDSIEKFVQELAWREYFQRVWQAKGDALFTDLKQTQPNVDHHAMVEALQEAQTGIQVLDQSIEQLYQSGYLHNHVRMYLSSIACNVGRAHWLEPSRWMYYHLLDGDLASNTCSWQWVAGAFSFKKYFANQENINRFSGSEQVNSYLDVDYEWLPKMPVPNELIKTCYLALATALPTTPTPRLDRNLPTLVYNSYNLDPHWRKTEQANRILLLEPSHFKKFPVSEKVLKFVIELSTNNEGIQCWVAEIDELTKLVDGNTIISKEHPAFMHYPGAKDERDWLFPAVKEYFPSFSTYWKKAYLSYSKQI